MIAFKNDKLNPKTGNILYYKTIGITRNHTKRTKRGNKIVLCISFYAKFVVCFSYTKNQNLPSVALVINRSIM